MNTTIEATSSEAEGRDWCDEFEELIENLNSRLHVQLPHRTRNYTVKIDIGLEMRVTASTKDEARRKAEPLLHDAERALDEVANVSSYPDSLRYAEVEAN